MPTSYAARGKSVAELILEADEISARARIALCRFQQSVIEISKLFPADQAWAEKAGIARKELSALTAPRQPARFSCGN